MPIYEFECPSCKARVEKLQKYSDPAPPCPQGCIEYSYGSVVAMKRLISAGAFELKGTGWYKTDFKGK